MWAGDPWGWKHRAPGRGWLHPAHPPGQLASGEKGRLSSCLGPEDVGDMGCVGTVEAWPVKPFLPRPTGPGFLGEQEETGKIPVPANSHVPLKEN